ASLLVASPDFEPDPATVVSRRDCRAASRDRQWLAVGCEGGAVVSAPPSGWEKLGHTPLDEVSLLEWEAVRAALAKGELSGDEERALSLVDALLARRWRHEVYAGEPVAAPGPHDICVEEVRP